MDIKVRFKSQPDQVAFFPTLRKRIDAYFEDNNIPKSGNIELYIQTAVMLSLYLVPYLLMMTGVITAGWAMLLCCVVMGAGVAGIGMCVMHDANHGSYSENRVVNKIMGYMMNFIGGHAFNWKVQHNLLHHTYTNILGMDEDIRDRVVLRLSPYTPLRWFHRFQHLYAMFLYGMMTLSWAANWSDFTQNLRYGRRGYDKMIREDYKRQLWVLSISKLFYVSYIIVLPMLLLDVAWWQVLIGFVIMHWVAGFILAVIFQMAHVVEETAHHDHPGEGGTIDNQWAVHQMETTSNFGANSWLLNFYAGGLTHQVEHHLFPNISHVHYRKIAPIVKTTAEEFGVPYYEQRSLFSAVMSHLRLLKELGRTPQLAPAQATPVAA